MTNTSKRKRGPVERGFLIAAMQDQFAAGVMTGELIAADKLMGRPERVEIATELDFVDLLRFASHVAAWAPDVFASAVAHAMNQAAVDARTCAEFVARQRI